MSKSIDSFNCRSTLSVNGKDYVYYSLPKAEANGLTGVSKLPYSMKVLLENLLRNEDGRSVTKKDIEEDPSAVTEMRAKLRAAGLGVSSSIPILDVAGTMLIGFSPRAIDAAIRSAK